MEQQQLRIDDQGYVYADGLKICRLDAKRGALLFSDRDRRRCAKRKSNQVPVSILALVRLIQENSNVQENS